MAAAATPPDTVGPWWPSVCQWVWIPLVTMILGLATCISVVLRLRMSRDVARLRTALRQLTTPEKQIPPGAFAFQEFGDVAAELADIAETLRNERARLADSASRDPLTGVPNRRLFIDTLARETAFARRTSWPLSLIMVDLDHFKSLNDEYGHEAGDVALRRTADRLGSLVRRSDTVARLGGEEFAVILPGARLDQATRIAQQLRDGLRSDQFPFDGNTISITASFGVAELHECRLTDSESLIRHADVAMYEAKRNGRDTVVAAPPARMTSTAAETGTESDRRSATPGLAPNEIQEAFPIDRDALALMGSTFSLLRLIPDKHRVAHDTIQQVAAVLQSGTVGLFLFGEGSTQLVPVASLGSDDSRTLAASDGLQQWAAALRCSSHFVPECYVEPKVVTDRSGPREVGVARLPLIAYGAVIGVIEARNLPSDFRLSKRQETVLSALAAMGATALDNCDTYERLTNRLCSLVEALCRAVHSGDAYRRNHCERVSALTVELAGAMGQHDEEELQLLRVAGLVHDLGRIALPDRLFKKKGRFRHDERKLMQEHCRIGADIMDGVTEMNRLAEIVRYHHEHYDGGGYPEGLAGNEIPIESRIIAVADAYVAMTSPRPHRPRLSPEDALERIRQEAGKQFDPTIVEVFLEWIGRRDLVGQPHPSVGGRS
jgi:diguanylate cyclase (GGDEF)-like protein/putative nucleotidyltransferase with HDIG domain